MSTSRASAASALLAAKDRRPATSARSPSPTKIAIAACMLIRFLRLAIVRIFRDAGLVSGRKCCVDGGKGLLALDICHLAYAQHAAQLLRRYLERARAGGGAGRRLRIGRRHRRVEGDVAFDLLQHLMDMAVKHGYGTEPLQAIERLGAVSRAPAPGRIDGPERDMREHDDGRAGRDSANVVLDPGELVLTQAGEAAGLEIDDIDERVEVNAAGIEAVPAIALRPLAVTLQEPLPAVDPVVLAGNIMDVFVGCLDDLAGLIELIRLGQMRDVARVNQEG